MEDHQVIQIVDRLMEDLPKQLRDWDFMEARKSLIQAIKEAHTTGRTYQKQLQVANLD